MSFSTRDALLKGKKTASGLQTPYQDLLQDRSPLRLRCIWLDQSPSAQSKLLPHSSIHPYPYPRKTHYPPPNIHNSLFLMWSRLIIPSPCFILYQADSEFTDPTEAAELKRKRTFRKYSYRGVELDKLLDLSNEDFIEVITYQCRAPSWSTAR